MNLNHDSYKISGFFQWPYVALLVLSAIWVILYTFSIFHLPNAQFEAWFSRLTAATLGSYLTVILVDRSFREKEKMEQQRLTYTALEALRVPLNRHLGLLVRWYTASLPEHPDELPSSWEELLRTDFVETVGNLDFSAQGPTTNEHETWLIHSANQLIDLKESINNITARYNHVLDPELMTTLQTLSTSMPILIQINNSRGEIIRLNGKNHADKVSQQLALVISDEVEEHINNLLTLLSYFDNDNAPNIRPFKGTCLHSDNTKPEIGSAHIDLEIQETS